MSLHTTIRVHLSSRHVGTDDGAWIIFKNVMQLILVVNGLVEDPTAYHVI
jgi:hypothetical protein